MQQLSLKTNIVLNDLVIKSVITDLAKITQETKTLAFGNTAVYSNIAQVFYIKTSSKARITLTKSSGSISFDVVDSCLLTDAFLSITIENTTASTTAEIFVVCG